MFSLVFLCLSHSVILKAWLSALEETLKSCLLKSYIQRSVTPCCLPAHWKPLELAGNYRFPVSIVFVRTQPVPADTGLVRNHLVSVNMTCDQSVVRAVFPSQDISSGLEQSAQEKSQKVFAPWYGKTLFWRLSLPPPLSLTLSLSCSLSLCLSRSHSPPLSPLAAVSVSLFLLLLSCLSLWLYRFLPLPGSVSASLDISFSRCFSLCLYLSPPPPPPLSLPISVSGSLLLLLSHYLCLSRFLSLPASVSFSLLLSHYPSLARSLSQTFPLSLPLSAHLPRRVSNPPVWRERTNGTLSRAGH